MIRIKRVYAPPDGSDGVRILVDRLWPRGVSKGAARIDEWRKDLAPSNILRKGFGHAPSKWEKFQSRYRNELEAAGKMDEFRILGERAIKETITLVYAARDEARNNAVVIKKLVEKLSGHSAAIQATALSLSAADSVEQVLTTGTLAESANLRQAETPTKEGTDR